MPPLPAIGAGPAGRRLLQTVVSILLVACSPWTGGATATVDPALESRTVLVGDEAWVVLIAPSDGGGMRGRSGFGGASGMIFDLGTDVDPTAVVFVMDGVAAPLDIAWFADDGALVGVASMAVCAAEPCPRYVAPGDFRWAIEAPPGAFDALPADARLRPVD